MRWPADTFNPFEPHRWFAWRPVRVKDQWFWLEHVDRWMGQDMGGSWWEYNERNSEAADKTLPQRSVE
jgi:hypothetical protein